ncbi:1-phosphatidylinositol 4,5-bisphosphate phosphodiesterase 1 [Erysiphe neolycopersici]|uniref:Phosphoinositide phospholipase C n=1 Tax=Erysiphe neolycopersici TaxID=212602 RepID=A0A420I5B3_9PEZI|nr:1-phosphatidylinositol 4,5-bisphosphate phosphodiesterase 1 [Erysiphe neolycopersici]
MPAPIDKSLDSSKVTNSCAQMPSPKLKSKMASQPILPPLTTSSLCYNFQSSYPTPVHSVASITSGSNQDSPTISPSSYHPFTNYITAQNSPNCFNGSDYDLHLTPLELPDSAVLRKTSVSAMSEAINISKSPGIIRRLSNRASQLASSRRRPSSNAVNRDQSSGPVILRRRSNSTSNASDMYRSGVIFYDSDDEHSKDIIEEIATTDEGSREILSRTVSLGSSGISTTLTAAAGPVVPSILLQGTRLMKVSRKKKKSKTLTFFLENEAAKVSWDKNRPSKSFYIDDIRDIRVGADARNYRQEFGVSAEDEPRFFSIVYVNPDKSKGRSQKIMHLIADDQTTFELWVTTLDAISKHRQDLMASLSSFHKKAVEQYWRAEMNKKFQDKPHSIDDEEIDFVGVERLCRSLHINGSSEYLYSKFNQADVTRSGRLKLSEFQEFVKLMKRREDVRLIYHQIAANTKKGVVLKDFFRFLREVQKENVEADRNHWEAVFTKFARRSKPKEKGYQDTLDDELLSMNESAFTNYLISTFNVPVHEQPTTYELERPLNEYFISSSHNTYLLGRQVAGQSSVEAYISALNRGCRCVEVDCWNGSDGPVVMHGRTLTSQVSFIDVMSTINKYAFVKSSYPLIISLEVHCNSQQQAMMVDIMIKTFGAKLVTAPLDSSSERIPSPSQLKNRILIKAKEFKTLEEGTPLENHWKGRNRGSSINSHSRSYPLDNSTVPDGGASSFNTKSQINPVLYQNKRNFGGNYSQDHHSSSTSDSEGFTEDVVLAKESNRVNKTSNIIKELGELAVYSKSIRFCGYDASESRSYNHVFSFSESTLDKNSKTQEDKHAILRHNIRHLMRVYPNGWRVASTNFDPLRYWRRGVQMVALNWQTYDLGMQINDAMFASGTDCSGYVLKPRELREEKYIPSIHDKFQNGYVKRERKNLAFSIDIISAQQLMRPKTLAQSRSFDPYIEVEVYHADDKQKENKGAGGASNVENSGKEGSSSFGVSCRRRTQIISENGFNPIFNKKFNFSLTTKYPDLVFIRWTVRYSSDGVNYSEKGAPLAICTAKLNSLKQGYRTLPLFDCNGDRFLFSTLFCRIKIKPLTSIYVNDPDTIATDSVGVLKTISRSVFNRTTT